MKKLFLFLTILLLAVPLTTLAASETELRPPIDGGHPVLESSDVEQSDDTWMVTLRIKNTFDTDYGTIRVQLSKNKTNPNGICDDCPEIEGSARSAYVHDYKAGSTHTVIIRMPKSWYGLYNSNAWLGANEHPHVKFFHVQME